MQSTDNVKCRFYSIGAVCVKTSFDKVIQLATTYNNTSTLQIAIFGVDILFIQDIIYIFYGKK